MASEPKKQHSFGAIKAKVADEKKLMSEWLNKTNRSTKTLDSFVVRMTIGEMEFIVKHIEELRSKTTDDWK